MNVSAPVASHGGTRPKPPQEWRSTVLRGHGPAAAAYSFRRIYETWPELAERYGERGRQLTAEDNHWHLTFLDTAAARNDPAHFFQYADWLVSFLVPRGLIPAHVAGAFRFLAESLEQADIAPDERGHRANLVGILSDAAARVEGLEVNVAGTIRDNAPTRPAGLNGER